MPKVLIVAYYFPPSGGPGVQRVLKFVQYLREFGWEPVVLTVEGGTYPATDQSLLREIPDGVKVYRTRIFEPYDLYRMLTGKKKSDGIDVSTLSEKGTRRSWTERLAEWIRATFFIPDARRGWKRYAVKTGKRLLRDEQIDLIYSSSPPYTCSLIARDLKRHSGLPWVAGFRDPWTGFLTTPDRWFLPARIDRSYERSVFTEADAVDVAWKGIAEDALKKYPSLSAEKFHHLPNGYDSRDFPADFESIRNDRVFTITYTGSMYGIRTPKEFLSAVGNLIERSEIEPDKLRLRFVGRFSDEVHDMFRRFRNPEMIQVHGYVPHSESIRILFDSDALLLVVDTTGDSAHIVPGKVYEYLGTLRPVIAVAPETGAIADLIHETSAGFVAHQSDVPAIESAIKTLYTDHYHGHRSVVPDSEAIGQYERRNITGKLASLFDSLRKQSTGTTTESQ